jgi:hypothetical protein
MTVLVQMRSSGREQDRLGRPVAFVVSAELAFVALMLACYAIEPSSKAVKRGLSYYGNSLTTGLPFAVAFALFIGLTALGIARLEAGELVARRFRSAVVVVLALMSFVPLTPYALDEVVDWLHIGVVSLLFLSALALGTWIVRRLRDQMTRVLYVIQSIAGLTILAAQVDLNDYMIPSELVFQLATFGLVLQGIRYLFRPCVIPTQSVLPSRHGNGAPSWADEFRCLDRSLGH